MRRAVIVALCTLLATPSAASAQRRLSSLHPGERIRITAVTDSSRPVVGRFRSAAGDTLVATAPWSREVEYFRAPIADVAYLEVSRGRDWWSGRGARVGALVGAAIPVLLYLEVHREVRRAGEQEDYSGFILLFGLPPGVVGGTVLGGLLGASHREEWQRVAPTAAPGYQR